MVDRRSGFLSYLPIGIEGRSRHPIMPVTAHLTDFAPPTKFVDQRKLYCTPKYAPIPSPGSSVLTLAPVALNVGLMEAAYF